MSRNLNANSRILQVLLSPRIGGAETLAAGLEREWVGAHIHTRTVYLDPAPRSGGFWKRLGRWRDLRTAVSDFQPTIIISHSALPSIYARIQIPFRVPVISVLHSAGDDFRSKLLYLVERILVHRTALVIAVSDEQGARYREHFKDAVPVRVIPNGITPGLPRKTTYASRPRHIVEMARVAEQKNPKLWIHAAEAFVKAYPSSTFSWWGPYTPQVHDDYRLPLVGDVRFLGPTPVPGEALLVADAFFHCASREAHSIGILEAAAVGLPVVCSDAVAATLPAGLPAAVFLDGDFASAGRALDRLYADYPDSVENARHFAEVVREDFGLNECFINYNRAILDSEVSRHE